MLLSIMLNMLGENLSRRHFYMLFLICPRKQDFTFHAYWDNLHEMSNIFYEKRKKKKKKKKEINLLSDKSALIKLSVKAHNSRQGTFFFSNQIQCWYIFITLWIHMLRVLIWSVSNKYPKHTGLDKSGYQVNTFLISPWKHMLWVVIRSTSLRRF